MGAILILLSGLAGILLGGVVQALIGQYAAFNEAKGMAFGLRAEITSLIELVRVRRYFDWIDGIIRRLESEATATEADFFSPGVTVEFGYFPVFKALSPRIGLLREASGPTVRAYALAQSVIEDFLALNKQHLRVQDGVASPNREGLLTATRELRGVLAEAVATGNEAIQALDRLASAKVRDFFLG